MNRYRAAAIASLLAVAVLMPPARQARGESVGEPQIVKIAWFAPLSLEIPLIASEMGFDGEFGVKLDLKYIARASDAMQALLAGDLDITFGVFLQPEAAKLKGAAVKGIMIAYYGGQKYALVTVKKTGISMLEDLAGKTIAVPGLGATPELFARKAAELGGVGQDTIKLVQQNLDLIPAALATGQVDAGVLIEPAVTGFLGKQEDALVIRNGIGIPVINYGPAAYFVRQDRLEKDRDLYYRVYLSLAKALWFIRTKGPASDEVMNILARAANVPPAILKPSADKNVWDPRIKPVQAENIVEEQKFFVGLGKLGGMVPVAEIWDDGFYQRALSEHPELFADLEGYLKALQENGLAGAEDMLTGLTR